jgi:protein-L-isoaspartate(D-aspartate) O-methyltransferase
LKLESRSIIFLAIITFSLVLFYSLNIDQGWENEYEEERKNMVETQLKPRGISDPRILDVMGKVPRHLFVRQSEIAHAYADYPLPIEEGQTISQPYVVALMTESLKVREEEKVLEIGTGSGYQAAVLAELCKEVYTIEIHERLAKSAEERLKDHGYSNVHVKWDDGYYGWEENAPYDAIIITCAVNHVPPYLLQQLKDGGRLILPLGSIHYYQTLTLIEKNNDEFKITHILNVRFVPMIGQALKTD